MACRSGCHAPGTHRSYGECARAAGIRIGQVDRDAEKQWDAELSAYASARSQGVQPAGTKMHQVREALDRSDQAGSAFNAGAAPTVLGGSSHGV